MTDQSKSCLNCQYHEVIADPDPNDWFCDDDKAIVCRKTPNDKQDVNSKYLSDRSEFKVVMPSIRPYKLEDESATPNWCPLLEK